MIVNKFNNSKYLQQHEMSLFVSCYIYYKSELIFDFQSKTTRDKTSMYILHVRHYFHVDSIRDFDNCCTKPIKQLVSDGLIFTNCLSELNHKILEITKRRVFRKREFTD